ncbi:unnamed protein product [Arctogadus glacialis]
MRCHPSPPSKLHNVLADRGLCNIDLLFFTQLILSSGQLSTQLPPPISCHQFSPSRARLHYSPPSTTVCCCTRATVAWSGIGPISHFLKGFNRQGHTFFMTRRPRRSQGCHCDAVTKLSDWLTTSGPRWPTSLRRAGLVVPGNAKLLRSCKEPNPVALFGTQVLISCYAIDALHPTLSIHKSHQSARQP